MTLVIPSGYAECSLSLRNSGDPDAWYVTFGVDARDQLTDPQDLATRIGLTFMDYFGARFSNTTSSETLTLRLGNGNGSTVPYVAPVIVGGGSSAAMLPQNCALLVDKLTSLPGRKGRGRMFIPNILREGSVNDVGVLDSTFFGEVTNSCQGFLAALRDGTDSMDGQEAPMVLLHNGTGSAGTLPTLVTSFQPQNVISTQRRRLRK